MNPKLSPTYVLRLKDMAYHFVLLLCLRCPRRSLDAVLGGRAWHPASCHQDNDVPNVSDVGYGTERVVHHRFLQVYQPSSHTVFKNLTLSRNSMIILQCNRLP